MRISDTIKRLRPAIAANGWALLPLRILVGYGFAAHGYAKLARGPEHFAAIVAALGLPAPEPLAWATTLLELIGGISLMIGAGVVVLSVPLAVVMATAMLGVHLRYGFSSIRLKELTDAGAQFGPVGYELNLLYVAALVALALSDSSPLSVDRWLLSKLVSMAGVESARAGRTASRPSRWRLG
jgi:putative oxidoreductase